jgi:EAL domain-containing protein (putative c-di-GMP-specific phosphodiesterase class I)
VRWRHPERGLIPPDIFIPLAEQSGLIQEIGEWVLDDACRQMAVWRDAGLQIPRVAVNLSAHQLGRSDLIQAVTETLAKYALAPSMLELELTETAIMRNPEKAHQTLEALADLGIALAVDDFGTGYSSLAYLQRLRLHRLKIDKTFVHDLPHNQNNTAICRAIIAMADSLGMVTVAEGVEEASQHDFLQASSCLIGQGWLFAKAMPAAELENWIKQTSISKQNA